MKSKFDSNGCLADEQAAINDLWKAAHTAADILDRIARESTGVIRELARDASGTLRSAIAESE